MRHAPYGRICAGENANLLQITARGHEKQRQQTPRDTVVEVVYQTGLAGRREGTIAPHRSDEDVAHRWGWLRGTISRLRARVRNGFSSGERKQESNDRDGESEEKRLRSQGRRDRELAVGERGEADGEIARELVDPKCKPAAGRSDKVDLHDHSHRPAEA